MTKEQIVEYVNGLKKKGRVISNFFHGQLEDQKEYMCKLSPSAIVVFVEEKGIDKLVFFYIDSTDGVDEFKKLIGEYRKRYVIEWFQKGTVEKDFEVIVEDDDKSLLSNALSGTKLNLYKKYIRITTVYSSNPKLVPEEGRRKILYDMYEPTGEYPTESDADELYKLCSETFDPITDDVFTLEEWREIIERKECMIHRNDDEIIAFYVWKLQGKTLYSNISLNRGPANYLYNMERRVFEHYWNEGIRSFYAWFDVKNKKALGRCNDAEKECIKSRSVLYNYVYLNENRED